MKVGFLVEAMSFEPTLLPSPDKLIRELAEACVAQKSEEDSGDFTRRWLVKLHVK